MMQKAANTPKAISTTSPNEAEIVIPGAACVLFWMLPGPSAFLEHVTTLFNRHRAVAVHLNERTVLGQYLLIDQALARSQFDESAATTLRVHDASQIDCDIAQHLCGSDGRKQISPLTLADWDTRAHQTGTRQVAPNTFVLRPRGQQALRAAWSYLCEFATALSNSAGNTRLILVRTDDEPTWSSEQIQRLRESGHSEALSFDGALGPDEMAAYLGMRMAISGFANTPEDVFVFPMKRLARALIAEFAGFDAHFAEGLMHMSDQELMGLPHSLGALATKLPVSDTVWRQTSAELGTLSTVQGKIIVHTLHEWHLATHSGPYQELAKKELSRKTWRAQLTALMPWFEQLRHALIGDLRPLLIAHLAPTHGFKVRQISTTGKERRTAIDDLECNDIASMMRDEPPLRSRGIVERAALDLCVRVARVRNEIAHMRPPPADEIQNLIVSLQNYHHAKQ